MFDVCGKTVIFTLDNHNRAQMIMSEDDRTLWVGNLTDFITEELLYELFLQVMCSKRSRGDNFFVFARIKRIYVSGAGHLIQLLNHTIYLVYI